MKKIDSEYYNRKYILKEHLKSMFDILQYFDTPNITLDQLCCEFVSRLTSIFDLPDRAYAKLVVGKQEFVSDDFVNTDLKYIMDFKMDFKLGNVKKHQCRLEICYFKRMPEINLGPFSEEDGFLVHFLVERLAKTFKRIEREKILQESEERFRALTESTSDFVWELDTNAVHKYINPRVKDVSGYEPNEVIGRTPFFFMSAEKSMQFEKQLSEIIKSCKPFERIENTMIHKDGHERIIESSGVPFFDDYGQLCGYRGIDRDITDRKGVEIALQESEEFRANFLDNSPNVVVVVNPDSSVHYVNPAFEKLTDFSSADVIGKITPYPWYTQDVLSKLSADTNEETSQQKEKTSNLYQKKDGELYYVKLTCTPVRNIDGALKYSLLTWIDITDEKKLREEMQFISKKLLGGKRKREKELPESYMMKHSKIW